MKWTQKQAQAIEERNFNLLVSAAAGSGKTAVLVERIKRLVIGSRTGLDRMLVVTFTKAAASEMKEKIQKSLYSELINCEEDKEKQLYLRQQLNAVSTANISTFHSFALEIVHRYYHIIGKPPRLAICDEMKQQTLKDEAMLQMFEALFDEENRDFQMLLDRYCTSRDNRILMEMILDFHGFMKSLPAPDQWFDSVMDMLTPPKGSLESQPMMLYLAGSIAGYLDLSCAYFNRAVQLLEECRDDGGRSPLQRLADKIKEDIASVESIKAVLEGGRIQDALAAVNEGLKFSTLRASKTESVYYNEDLKSAVAGFRSEGKRNFGKIVQWCVHGTVENIEQELRLTRETAEIFYRLVKDFDKRYAQKKESLKLLDFSDIEHFALQILDNPSVCNEYKDQFDFIFIDEYQDSNMVQESLIKKICRDDNLFMVGDVKQSIYKFRLAEPELFIKKYFEYKSGKSLKSKTVDLNSNFRSKEGIVSFVNALFGVIMNKKATGLDYDEDAALVKGSFYSGPCDFDPVLYLVSEQISSEESRIDKEEESVPDETGLEIEQLKLVELEALQAVSIIRENRGALVHDDKNGCERPLDYRDMVILLRATKGAGEVFYKALADADIPVFLDRNEGYFDTLEIKVFLNLLRLIDNRKQDIPFITVLHSPVFGFTADELAEIRIFSGTGHKGKISYFDAFKNYLYDGRRKELKHKCRDFWEQLSDWRLRAAHTPLGDFLWNLIVDTGYQDFVGAIPGGAQRKANLLALVDKATAYETMNYKGLSGFINYIEAVCEKKGKVDIGQAKILSEGANVVRIMTIHKSKGLEFPFVLLGGMCKKLNAHTNRLPVAYDKDIGFGFRLVNPHTGLYLDTLPLKIINDKRQQEELAESIRILYVALTRPRDRLFLLGSAKNAEKTLEKARNLIPGDVRSAGTFFDMVVAATGDFLPVKIIGKSELESVKERTSANQEALKKSLEKGFVVDEKKLPLSKEKIIDALTFRYMQEESEKKRKYSVSQLAAMERMQKKETGGLLITKEDQEYDPEDNVFTHDFKFGVPRFLSSKPGLSGAEKGTAYHTVMEHIPFVSNVKREADIVEFIGSLVRENILTAQEASAIDPTEVAKFFTSQTGRRVLEAGEIFKEAPFIFKTVYGEREVILQGVIDCYFKEEDSLVIVDYKSNYVDTARKQEEMERIRQEYLPQMRFYKEALEAVSEMNVKECIIYVFGMNDQIRLIWEEGGKK